MNRSPRLAAVVLNFRTFEQTRLTVRSLLESHRAIDDLIIVNNDQPSTEHHVLLQLVRQHVRWLDTGRNLGFSGGMNVGIRAALEAGADRVLLVNSDVTVPPDCVEQLERCLESRPDAGIIGPVIVDRSNPARVASLGMMYSSRTGRMRHRAFRTPVELVPSRANLRVDAVSGCLMLVTRSVFDTAGLFDEDYFFSFEDLDLCFRAQRAGYVTMVATNARVHHEGSGTIGRYSTRRLYFAARNHLLFADRSDMVSSTVVRRLRSASIVLFNLVHALRSEGATPSGRISAVMQGTRDYFGGELGEGGRCRV